MRVFSIYTSDAHDAHLQTPLEIHFNTSSAIAMPQCDIPTCKRKIAIIIGECTYCKKKFCATHRLPETHDCTAMDVCHQTAFDINAAKLFAGKCVKAKIY
jgi:predicted nucleic acid binding AN1-type Zn finger protein